MVWWGVGGGLANVGGGGEAEHPIPGEIIFAEGNVVLTRRWSWRQGEHTLTLPETKSIEFNVDGLPPVDAALVEEICMEVRELVERFWEAFGRPWSSEELTRDLLDACHEGRWAHVDLLLDLGANALATDERGYTCLMLACSRARAPVTVVERLIALGVDVAAVANDDQGKPVSAKSLLAQHNQQQTSRSQRRLQEADEAMARGRQQWLESQYRHQATTANPRPRM